MEEQQILEMKKLHEALANKEVGRIYANGISVFTSTADMGIALQLDGTPICIVHLSYTLAKSLSQHLAKAVADLEQKSGNTIMDSETIQEKLLGSGSKT